MYDETTSHPDHAQPYATPTLVDLGSVRAITLGSARHDTADKKKYYN
ncbi:hypothetical protein Nocox_37330 [Nonomuraea coxensis DSM 45129]|uniref:Lasso RiPP family leader peptide-containing protein n=1 Tax=Nonomuraea coxensis DSM 45129 TaxID=1122611 RepID=A0ABX8UBX5_9ACTN|nr:lasso RiPP family leader peptide-containing protein [Nonomuraea coxensis]QYC45020.1 hypothetical protein Nocox_37330 [Nonomuraea coxensis DSM 45129]